MEEKLIEAVRMHPCLFDKSSVVFRNKYLKDRAWQAVAASTGVSVEDHCKGRWKSLRDRFVREISANNTKSGAAAEFKTEWCYMESMRFLTKHVAPRKTSTNFQWMDSQTLNEEPSCSLTPPMFPNEEPSCSLTPPMLLNEEPSCSQTPSISNNQSSEDASSIRSTKRQRTVKESRDCFDRLCGTIEAVIASKTENVPSRNSTFLKLLDECLQKKPEEVQDRLKIELLAYVHNAS